MRVTAERETKLRYEQSRIKVDTRDAQAVIIVGRDGWNYSQYDKRQPDRWGRSSRGKNVRISMNGPLALTVAEWQQLVNTVNAELAEHGI